MTHIHPTCLQTSKLCLPLHSLVHQTNAFVLQISKVSCNLSEDRLPDNGPQGHKTPMRFVKHIYKFLFEVGALSMSMTGLNCCLNRLYLFTISFHKLVVDHQSFDFHGPLGLVQQEYLYISIFSFCILVIDELTWLDTEDASKYYIQYYYIYS